MRNKLFLFVLGILFSMSFTHAQLSKTVHVTTPGTLGTLLGSDLTKVTDLTITGTINAADFTSLRSTTALKNLDMSNSSIVDGKIPNNAFESRKMDKIILSKTTKIIGEKAFRAITINSIDFSQAKELASIGMCTFEYANIKEKVINLKVNNKLTSWSGNLGPFSNFSDHVILPEEMKILPNNTFFLFKGTTELPNELETIGSSAFDSAIMDELVLPNSVKTIGDYAFKAFNVKKLTLSSNLTKIGNNAFISINVPEIDFSVAKDLEYIGTTAFSYANITSRIIDLSSNNKLITMDTGTYGASGTFSNCYLHVILPKEMKTLPNAAFKLFKGTVELPKGLENIGSSAFDSAVMDELVLPNSVKTIGDNAFKAFNVKKLTLSSNLTKIGNNAFISINVPEIDFSVAKDLEYIGTTAFSYANITSKIIDLSSNNKLITMDTGTYGASGTFSNCYLHVILPKEMKTLPNAAFKLFKGTVELPEGLIKIGDAGFSQASILEITIPKTVNLINKEAFFNCSQLTTLVSLNPTPPALGSKVFEGVNKSTCTLYVPKGSMPLYAAADQWKDFLNIQEYNVHLIFNLVLNKDEDPNIYKVKTGENFNINAQANIMSRVRIGLFSYNGAFGEDITSAISGNTFTCNISQNVKSGGYTIAAYIIEDNVPKMISRKNGSHYIDRIPLTLANNWNEFALRSTSAINANILIDTGSPDLMEVNSNKDFKVYLNSSGNNINLGLFDEISGNLITKISETKTNNLVACKIPYSTTEGKYNLIPYIDDNGTISFVERYDNKQYLEDRLPLYVKPGQQTEQGIKASKKIKLLYSEDYGQSVKSEYDAVRVGEYYWMNTPFRDEIATNDSD